MTTDGLKKYLEELHKYLEDAFGKSFAVRDMSYYLDTTFIITMYGIETVLYSKYSISYVIKSLEENDLSYSKAGIPSVLYDAIFDINTGLFLYKHLTRVGIGLIRLRQTIFNKRISFVVKHDFNTGLDYVVLRELEDYCCNCELPYDELDFEYPLVRLRESLIDNVIRIQASDVDYLFLNCCSYVVDTTISKVFLVFVNHTKLTLYLHSNLESFDMLIMDTYTEVSVNVITSRNIKDSVLVSLFYRVCLCSLFGLVYFYGIVDEKVEADILFLQKLYRNEDYRSIVEYDNKHGIVKLYEKARRYSTAEVVNVNKELNIQYLD